MRFEDWKTHFNRIFVCKIFNETWSQFSIQGEWKGNSNGGPYPVEAEDAVKKEETKIDKKKEGGVKTHAIDTNDKWFNNPQYRLTVHKKTTVIISLMQEDVNTPQGKPYISVNFMVVRVKSKKDRLWEVRKEDIILNAGVGANRLGQREITETLTLTNIHDKKNCHYIIVPNVENESSVKKEGRQFFLRVFASEHCDLVELPKTVEQTFSGEWTKASGGGRRVEGTTENQFWCRNPQYFLNITKPTHLKIILKKKQWRKTKFQMCGITITKANPPTMPPPSNIIGKDKKKGEVTVPTSLPRNGMTYAMTLNTLKKDTGDIKIPEFEPPNLNG